MNPICRYWLLGMKAERTLNPPKENKTKRTTLNKGVLGTQISQLMCRFGPRPAPLFCERAARPADTCEELEFWGSGLQGKGLQGLGIRVSSREGIRPGCQDCHIMQNPGSLTQPHQVCTEIIPLYYGCVLGTLINGSTFWILPGVWESQGVPCCSCNSMTL